MALLDRNSQPPPNGISADGINSRAASTLAADAVFQGVGEDVTGFGRVGVGYCLRRFPRRVRNREVCPYPQDAQKALRL